MKKQGAGKKGLLGILIAIGALILVGAVILGVMLLGAEKEPPASNTEDRIVLYWNVDRSQYVGKGINGASGRNARPDGYYYIRFAVGGEQVDYQVADVDLVQKIDQLDVMGLEFDEQGVITGVKNVNECTGGMVATALYVKSLNGNTLECNTQGTYKGVDVTLELSEDTEVYDVGQTGLLCGMPSTVGIDDEIMAVKDYDGKIIYIFKESYLVPSDVYWNINRMYNSESKTSTREMDSMGFYVFDMALNGEVVQVKTRNYDIATQIDANAAKCVGLQFDENGYVSGVLTGSKATGGATFASWAHVFSVKDGQVTAKKLTGSLAGTEYVGTISPNNCKIINISGIGGEIGSYTELQYGDQIHGLTDVRGRLCYVFVIKRLSSSDGYNLYWNVERQYDSEKKVTKRTPSADGYYYIVVATGGQQVTVKTKDKEMVTKLDSNGARCFALKLTENNEIMGYDTASTIHGGVTFGSWYYVDKIDGKKVTVSRILTGDKVPTVVEGVLAENVEIINGSDNFSSHCGEYGKLGVGDRIHGLTDLDGNVRVIFIVNKAVPGPVYWNINKKAVENNMTTRERAEDGYFYFEMTGGGKQYTFKTKDAEIATQIDSVSAKCMGLTVTKDGVITKFHTVTTVQGCQGGTQKLSWVDVLSVSGRTVVAQKDPNSAADTAGQIFTTKMASNCKVYNVSPNYSDFCGEETNVRVGDRIQVLHNRNSEATLILVVERAKTLNEQNACPCDKDVTWEPWDGTTELENGKYYYLTADVKAPAEGFVLDGKTVSLRLDGHTISSVGRCFFLKGSTKLNICDHETRGKLIGSGVDGESGGLIRLYNSACNLNLWNIDLEYQKGSGIPKEGGVISSAGTTSVYNCNLKNGECTYYGGNIVVGSNGTLRMFGGSMEGGSARSGNCIYVNGRLYLEGVTVAGGNSEAVVFNTDKDINLNGVTIDQAYGIKGTVTLMGTNKIGGLFLSDKTVLADGGIEPGGEVKLTNKTAQTRVVMTGASEVGYKSLTSWDNKDYPLSYDAGKKTVSMACAIAPADHTNTHCTCAGNASGLGQHICKDLSGWTELTASVLVESPTAGNLAFPASGNYYLSFDMELSNSIDILPGQEITLCLNGCEMTGSKRIFRINGTLNLTDCTGEGKVIGRTAMAPVFYTYSGGTFNLFGGTLSSSYSGSGSYWGGVGALASDAGNAADRGPSVMNMYGGAIIGQKLSLDADQKYGFGGAIYSMSNTFNMYGGTIVGGSAPRMGGSIYANGSSVINLLGGKISGGQAPEGGDIYITASVACKVGGNMQIGDLYVPKGLDLQVQELKPEAAVGITMAVPGLIAEYSGAYTEGNFTSVDNQYQVVYSGTKLKMELSGDVDGHVHCVCGGTANGVHAHECTKLIYEAWEATDSLPTEAGNYYLTADVHLTEMAKTGTAAINLCLNGHKISGDSRLIWVDGSGAALNICEHAGSTGILEGPGVADGNSGGLIRHGKVASYVGLYNLTMRRTDTEGTRTAVKDGGIMNCSGSLDMYNVTMEDGFSTGVGGNLTLSASAKLNMVGCTLKNGTSSASRGGNLYVSTGAGYVMRVYIADSSFTGGSAKTVGSGVVVDKGDLQVTLSGKVDISDNVGSNLYISKDHKLILDGLSSESTIGIIMEKAGVIAESSEDLSACFTSENANLQVFHDEKAGEIYLAQEERAYHLDHCICGGTADGVGDHVCGEAATWTLLTEDVLEKTNGQTDSVQGWAFKQDGRYYLEGKLEVDSKLCILPGQDITICLNGYELTNLTDTLFYVAGKLTIVDCTGTGSISGACSNTTSNGGVVNVLAGGSFNLFGGTVRYAGTGVNSGGAVVLSADQGNLTDSTASSQFNMYGGSITGGIANDGGNLCILNESVFNMYGGSICDGTASVRGANILLLGTNAKMNLLGGTVTEGDVYALEGDVILGGDVQIDQLRLADGMTVALSTEIPMTGSYAVGIQMDNPQKAFATVSEESMKNHFFNAEGFVEYKPANQGLYLVEGHVHCVCEGSIVKPENHSCDNVTWVALKQEHFDNATETSQYVKKLTMIDESGETMKDESESNIEAYVLDPDVNYFLSEDITTSGYSIACTADARELKRVGLCLNGFTLKCTDKQTLYINGTIDLCDCRYNDETVEGETVRVYKGIVSSTLNGSGSVANVCSNGILNMYGGNMVDGTPDTAKSDAIVYMAGLMNMYGGKICDANTTVGGNMSILNGGTFYMYAGTITNGYAASNGGNILINSGAIMYMHGGAVTDGEVLNTKSGGNIRVNGTLEMSNGVISGGIAKEGGNIAIGGAGQVTMSGGTVTGGEAISGGNFVVFGKLTVTGNAIIENGVSTGASGSLGGGNIYGAPNYTELVVTGGTIRNGKAQSKGANIYLRDNTNKTVKLSITGGVIGGIAEGSSDAVKSVYLHHYKDTGSFAAFIGGNAKVDEIHCTEAGMLQLAESGIEESASVYVSLEDGNGVAVTQLDPAAQIAYESIIKAAQTGKKTAVDGSSLVIEDE